MLRPVTNTAWHGMAAILLSVLVHVIVLSQWAWTPRPQTPSSDWLGSEVGHPALTAPIQVRLAPRDALQPAKAGRVSAQPRDAQPEPGPMKAEATPSPESTPTGVFRPAWEVDQPPLPASEPSLDNLEVPARVARRILLRIYVDTSGRVVRVESQGPDEDNDELLQKLVQAFTNTKFIPGMDGGASVSTYLDVEISPEPAPL